MATALAEPGMSAAEWEARQELAACYRVFDMLGWSEMILIGVVALIVVGPKELPNLFRSLGQAVGKARGMAREFTRAMEAAADESGMREIDRAGMSVATATASGAASLVAGYDYGNLEILARNVARQPDVIRVSIRNLAGRVMSEAAGETVGTYKRYEAPIVFDSQNIGSVSVDISTQTLENALNALYWRVFVEQAAFGRAALEYRVSLSLLEGRIRSLLTAITGQ